MAHGSEGPAGAAARAAGVVQADQLLLSHAGMGAGSALMIIALRVYRMIIMYLTEPPSPRTSSPSDMSSGACGQSGHTTPMEDSDKRKCTFNFCFLILSERMIKSSQRWFKGH